MKILVDVNPSPRQVATLTTAGHEVLHWSDVGPIGAPDSEIFEWARAEEHLVFTHDLDFGALLAMTRASGPSVLQVRTQDVLPSSIGPIVIQVLEQHASALRAGAIVSLDERASRIRLLPLMK